MSTEVRPAAYSAGEDPHEPHRAPSARSHHTEPHRRALSPHGAPAARTLTTRSPIGARSHHTEPHRRTLSLHGAPSAHALTTPISTQPAGLQKLIRPITWPDCGAILSACRPDVRAYITISRLTTRSLSRVADQSATTARAVTFCGFLHVGRLSDYATGSIVPGGLQDVVRPEISADGAQQYALELGERAAAAGPAVVPNRRQMSGGRSDSASCKRPCWLLVRRG